MNEIVFDYDSFFKNMKKNPIIPQKRETALKYELLFGSQEGQTVQDQPFYKDYLSKFLIPFQVAIPNEGNHDWGLLLKLIFGSFTSEYILTLEEEWKNNPIVIPMVQLTITAHLGDQSVSRNLDEMFNIQICRLFEILVDEQINMAILRQDENGGEAAIDSQREQRISLYKKKSLMVMQEVNIVLTLTELISTI